MRVESTLLFPALAAAGCISNGDQSTINTLLRNGGANTVVQLCENATIQITDKITFTADGQEISTQNYPTGSTRATLRAAPGSQVSTLIEGHSVNSIKIKNIQIDGNRPGAGYLKTGGANIEIGGTATGQTVQYVNSRNPRGWSCLHIIGSGNDGNPCKNAQILNNDIGPCGEEGHNANGDGLWADGVSLDCTNSLVQDNTVSPP